MISLDIQDVIGDYPAFQVAFAVIGGMAAPGDCGPGIEHLAATAEAEALEILHGQEVAEHTEIQQWRGAYRQFGIKKTSYRNACEALLRRIKRGDGLPRVLPLVDLYNALSIKYRIPVGADDVAALSPPLAFRHSRPGDGFRDLAGDPAHGLHNPMPHGRSRWTPHHGIRPRSRWRPPRARPVFMMWISPNR